MCVGGGGGGQCVKEFAAEHRPGEGFLFLLLCLLLPLCSIFRSHRCALLTTLATAHQLGPNLPLVSSPISASPC